MIFPWEFRLFLYTRFFFVLDVATIGGEILVYMPHRTTKSMVNSEKA